MNSMRARMTAGFVFILAPCLLILSWVLPVLSNRLSEIGDKKLVSLIASEATELLSHPDWRADLTRMMNNKVPKTGHLALLVVDTDGTVLWRSRRDGPPWPPGPADDWNKALAMVRAKAAGKITSEDAIKMQVARPVKELAYPAGAWPLPEKEGGNTAVVAKKEVEARLRAEKEGGGFFRAPERPWLPWGNEKALAALKMVRAAEDEKRRAEARSGAGRAERFRYWSGTKDDWLVIASAVAPGPQPRILFVAQSWRAILQDQTRQKVELLCLSLFAVLGVAGGAWLLVGRTLSPIGRLAVQAGAASVERLEVRLKAPSRDAEVVELVDTLNGLLSRLAETAAAKGRFYAAASHELRTPLQALSGHLEVALTRARTADEYEQFLQESLKQTRRLTSLVQDLLLLHQLDSAPPRPQEPVDLAEVCTGVLDHLQPLVEARGLPLSVDLPAGACILAVPTHAEILVRNLIENAVRYASPGGAVTVALSREGTGPSTESGGGAPCLEVFNECPPLGDRDPQKLFEPFYRPDTARNSRTGGNGLGLAICRAIATANGWQVTLQQEPQGVRAVALFPPSRSLPETPPADGRELPRPTAPADA